jgi:hypothetical protein
MTERNSALLSMLRDIQEVSATCKTRTYIWAGLVQDVLSGKFLREHGDVDGFVLDLWTVWDEISAQYKARGYSVSTIAEIDSLRIEANGVHAVFNCLQIDGATAVWHHAGRSGALYFPKEWLSEGSCPFHDTRVFVSGVEFEFLIKTHPDLLNPNWKGRESDRMALDWLSGQIDQQRWIQDKAGRRIWSHTPYWAKRGYKRYEEPIYITE